LTRPAHTPAVNESGNPIQDIYVTNGPEVDQGKLLFDRPATVTLSDSRHGFWIYHLSTPSRAQAIDPDSLSVRLSKSRLSQQQRAGGVLPITAPSSIGDYFPQLGYDPGRELDNPVRRREEKLGRQEELPDRGDPYGMNTGPLRARL